MDDNEEIDDPWQEHWLMLGYVSKAATEAVESVGGRIVRMSTRQNLSLVIYGVCLLHHPDDDEQGFTWFTDDDKRARRLNISSADGHHDLYIHCADGFAPRFETDTTELRLITEEEWFKIADEQG